MRNDKSGWHRIRRRFQTCLKRKDYLNALEAGLRLCKTYESEAGLSPRSKHCFTDLYNLGFTYHMLGNLSEALRLYNVAYRVGQNGFGSIKYTDALMNMAVVYAQTGEYKKAENLFRNVLKMNKRQDMQSENEYHEAVYNLGNTYAAAGDNKAALAELMKAANFFKHAGSRMTADVFASVAFVMENTEDYGGAAVYLEAALAVMRKIKAGQEEIRQLQYYLAKVYKKSGEPEKAWHCCDVLKNELRGYFPSLMGTMAEIAEEAGDPERTLRCRLEELAQIKQFAGSAHLGYAQSLRDTALAYKALKQHEQAAELLTEHLQITERLLGYDERYFRSSIELINLRAAAGQSAEALELLLALMNHVPDDEDVMGAMDGLLEDLAKAFMGLGDLNLLNEIYNAYMTEAEDEV